MVLHESRKYGMARSLTRDVARAQQQAGRKPAPWVHLNDVAGFIGPEVFRTKEQLVRCCLEDIVMGKLHGLCIGLDVKTQQELPVAGGVRVFGKFVSQGKATLTIVRRNIQLMISNADPQALTRSAHQVAELTWFRH